MCGLAGIFHSFSASESYFTQFFNFALSSLNHRGPDSCGTWIDSAYSYGVCHTRLSIVDQTGAANQPMFSNTGRYVLAFNGEIYNHLELRDQIKGYQWKSASDTEVILAMIERFGLNECVSRLSGMFAFSIWDRQKKELSIVRDRMGEKPIFYKYNQSSFSYASEIGAFFRHGETADDIDPMALHRYFNSGYVYGENTFWKDIRRLDPGSILTVSFHAPSRLKVEVQQYWSPTFHSQTDSFSGPEKYTSSIATLHGYLESAVRSQLEADVKVGVALSGGIDSSLVTALAQNASSSCINTYSVGFKENGYDESDYAGDVAKFLKTNHTHSKIESEDLIRITDSLPLIYGEPFADPAAIGCTYLGELAKKDGTKVLLSGDGADELFAGYSHYYYTRASVARRLSLFLGSETTESIREHFLEPIRGWMPEHSRFVDFLNHMCQSNDYLRSLLLTRIPGGVDALKGAKNIKDNDLLICKDSLERDLSFCKSMMLQELIISVPERHLTKVDRAFMRSSVEGRSPFLDKAVVGAAQSLSDEFLVNSSTNKRILKDILSIYLPKKLWDRPKQGFSMPIDVWLRTVLRDWADELLSVDSLSSHGLLNVDIIRQKWHEHQNGTKNHKRILWSVLMFQRWAKSLAL